MTEAEARKKWCPFARVPDSNGIEGVLAATNRHAGEKTGRDGKPRVLRGNAMCIASECMAWRTGYENTHEMYGAVPDGDGWEKDGSPVGRVQIWRRPTSFCGLAGKP
jgi:hypothetical protein